MRRASHKNGAIGENRWESGSAGAHRRVTARCSQCRGVRVACREIRLARRCELAQTTRPEDASLARTRMSYSSCRSSGFHNSRTNCPFTLKLVIWACPVAMSAVGTDLPVRGSENFGQKETTIPLDSRRSEPPERPFAFLHRGLLVIVRPTGGISAKSPHLRLR